MVGEGIWRERRRKHARINQRRMRRPSYGELIQIDGSPHDWYEGRWPKCTLIVFIDDATSAQMALRFALLETLAYMETLRGYLNYRVRFWHGADVLTKLKLYCERKADLSVQSLPSRNGSSPQRKTLGNFLDNLFPSI